MLYAIAAVIALIIDQAVKYWTTAHIVLNAGTKKLIPGFIHLTNLHNTGAAFSFLEGARWFFIVLCIVFVAAVIFLLAKNIIKGNAARWMSVMVLAGAVGNCIDRIINGYVVDMFEFEFKIFGMSFPVFNVADILITVGGILFCIFFLLEPSEPKKSAVSDAAAKAGAIGVIDTGANPANISSFSVPSEKKGAEKPHSKRRRKIDIPDFPKHPHTPEPAIDPNDPFAEWERIAAGKSPASVSAPAAAGAADSEQNEIDVKEIRSDDEPTARPVSELETLKQQIAEPKKAGAHVSAPADAGNTQAQNSKPLSQQSAPSASSAGNNVSYDLEDILAEFKDL